MLIGHQAQRRELLDALASGRMHHAWLLAGPRGIGKRRFADWAALKLLSGMSGPADTDPDHPAARLAQADSHPDLRLLQPPTEGTGSATASIIVEQVREMRGFLHSTPAMGGWRVLIVDALDNMNASTSNAFLKELEEPQAKTVFFLVSHAPGRLLPTIRSRCRMLRLGVLDEAETREVMHAHLPELEALALERLVGLAAGAPGAVLGLGGEEAAGLVEAVERVAAGGSATGFARGFQAAAAVPRWQALVQLVPRRVAQAARQTGAAELLALYDEAETISRDAVRLAYDRVQVAMALADILARMGRLEGQVRAR